VACTDLFYDTPPEEERRWIAAGAMAVEMESATLFALARRRGLRAAALLAVSDLIVPTRRRIAPQDLREAELRLGEVALSALQIAAAPPQPA
jgi:purine-nucleoside phosphorylase